MGAARERKAGEKSLVPPPNRVTLSGNQNVLHRTGCPVTAWVGFNQYPTANYTVNFVKVSGTGSAPPAGVSNTKGEVKRTVAWNTVIQAEVQSHKALLTSDNFACGGLSFPTE